MSDFYIHFHPLCFRTIAVYHYVNSLGIDTSFVKHHAETYSDSPPPPPIFFFHIAHCSGHVITQNTTNTCKIIKLKFNFISVNQALGQTSPPRIFDCVFIIRINIEYRNNRGLTGERVFVAVQTSSVPQRGCESVKNSLN